MAAAAAAAQWCGAAGLDRWVGRWRCTLSPAALPVPSRRTRRKGGVVGCVSVPREVAAAAAVEPAAPPEAEAETEEEGVECEGCNGAGWLLCDFCKGKKNNVKSESSRIYRRCPTCKAAGYILCPRCRVYKCITYPESNDS
ncbi:uncharacterized protein [Oryza sativa Japonica Group]|uniref:Uncharacterized protein n=1 Tax=Oryza sativa subsp. japonica TaxID=39947 RepID=B9G1U6_ORYSJ|nr:protein PHOTOSYSTEM I ASSEMBLY 2, chloroplastic isoform X2 [Oryza sativa Japonica Group]XP_052164977.1 protein PHOTOSYSTEM I ASSEMBLY 2, chloroplastic isoform X2 [Oryza glaberrima]EEE69013.1 hypothetical protein OsJ_27968 [Oryza sativa Japonica Group]KAF2920536.1 hypothetical protein DAI22_08g216300 [Oryza sativa Japonica Group]